MGFVGIRPDFFLKRVENIDAVEAAATGDRYQKNSDEKSGVFYYGEALLCEEFSLLRETIRISVLIHQRRGSDSADMGLSWQLISTMITYKEIAFTAYAVTDMRKARKFYEGVLGLKPAREFSKNFVEYDIGQGTISVGCAPKMWPPSKKGTTAALEVTDFEEALEHLKKKKVKPALGPLDFPSCRMVGVRDPDGNMIVLHKRKKK